MFRISIGCEFQAAGPATVKELSAKRALLLVERRRFTHRSGHTSAAGRAQDRESSLVKDRRSTTVPHNKLSAESSYSVD